MSWGGRRLTLATEIGWLVLSTALLAALVVREPGAWRAVWLGMLVVNAAVGGFRIKRLLAADARSAQPPT